MVIQSTLTATPNGVASKLNGKLIKSKNQLRRLKLKEKKLSQASDNRTIVRGHLR